MSMYITERKLTLSEWLTKLHLQLERSEIQWLSREVSKRFHSRYPDEPLKKVYRPNDRGKSISIGYGYDERIVPILDELIQL